jgi:putative DNA primase/helicase
MKVRGGASDIEDEDIIAQVRFFMETHGESRFTLLNASEQVKEESRVTSLRAGFRQLNPVTEETDYFIFKDTFRKEICKSLSWERAEEVLANMGALKRDHQGNCTIPKRLPESKQQRLYFLTSKLWSDHVSVGTEKDV